MSLPIEYFRRQILRRPTEAIRPFRALANPLLTQSKVSQPNVTSSVEEDVLGLEITVDYIEGVDVLDC